MSSLKKIEEECDLEILELLVLELHECKKLKIKNRKKGNNRKSLCERYV